MIDWEEQILSSLASDCGRAVSVIAKNLPDRFGHNNKTHSGFVLSMLLRLEKRGVVRRLDAEKPIAWMLNSENIIPLPAPARCQVTCGEYPSYYKCSRPAKYVTDGSKPPGPLFVCGLHKRGRNVKPIAPNEKAET